MDHIKLLNEKIRLNISLKIKANLMKFQQKFNDTHYFFK
jgi:hypothetical protein